MRAPLIVIWNDDQPDGRSRWSIRGIQPNGSFHGCATFYDEMRTMNLQGELSQDDNAEVWLIANDIRRIAGENGKLESGAPWDGLLAEGAYNSPRIIFHYRREDGEQSLMGQKFNRLKSLLRPYAERAVGCR